MTNLPLFLAAGVSIAYLAGCMPGAAPTADLSSIEVRAQNVAIALCGFLPTADTIGAIVAANDPKLQTAELIGAAICAAVSPSTAIRGLIATTPAPRLPAGITVVGAFVKVN